MSVLGVSTTAGSGGTAVLARVEISSPGATQRGFLVPEDLEEASVADFGEGVEPEPTEYEKLFSLIRGTRELRLS